MENKSILKIIRLGVICITKGKLISFKDTYFRGIKDFVNVMYYEMHKNISFFSFPAKELDESS